MNLTKLVITNAKNYGILNTLLLLFYELIYSININYFKQIFFDENKSDKYVKAKKSKNYNSPYCPTPIFFLRLIKTFLDQYALENFSFIDFGSGTGRTLLFFSKSFKNFFGIEFNNHYRKFYKKKQFILMDLRKKNNFNFLINSNNNFILFFFDPFEQNLAEKILIKFKHKRYILILINYKKLNTKYGKILFEKIFANKSKNIRIYTNSHLKKVK